MSTWSHRLCGECWFVLPWTPSGERIAVRLKDDEGFCCNCDRVSRAGIFVRRSSDEMPCKGKCEEEE